MLRTYLFVTRPGLASDDFGLVFQDLSPFFFRKRRNSRLPNRPVRKSNIEGRVSPHLNRIWEWRVPMSRVSKWAACAIAVSCLAGSVSEANAADVVVTISGTFGDIGYGNQPALLNGGSFSGTVTFAALPAANTQAISQTADVNFFNGSHQFLFNVGGNVLYNSYDTLNAGPSGYTSLSVGGTTTYAGDTFDISSLNLSFNNWLFGQQTGTVIGYGDPSYGSYISYTDTTTTLSYASSVLSGQASVPEPSAIALGLLGMAGVCVFTGANRRKRAPVERLR